VTVGGVRINCIGLLGLHHLFYKGVVGPLGLQGGATPGATSPGRRLPWSHLPLCRLPWSRPTRVTGVWPIRVYSCAPPHVPPPLGAASPGAGPRRPAPPYKCNISPINTSIQFYSYSSPLTDPTNVNGLFWWKIRWSTVKKFILHFAWFMFSCCGKLILECDMITACKLAEKEEECHFRSSF
jgi:hypothetical protein